VPVHQCENRSTITRSLPLHVFRLGEEIRAAGVNICSSFITTWNWWCYVQVFAFKCHINKQYYTQITFWNFEEPDPLNKAYSIVSGSSRSHWGDRRFSISHNIRPCFVRLNQLSQWPVWRWHVSCAIWFCKSSSFKRWYSSVIKVQSTYENQDGTITRHLLVRTFNYSTPTLTQFILGLFSGGMKRL